MPVSSPGPEWCPEDGYGRHSGNWYNGGTCKACHRSGPPPDDYFWPDGSGPPFLYLKRDVAPATTRAHEGPCIYCDHGPYCLTCPPPPVIADDAPVCGRCREAITRSEIAADPYYSGGAVFGDGA